MSVRKQSKKKEETTIPPISSHLICISGQLPPTDNTLIDVRQRTSSSSSSFDRLWCTPYSSLEQIYASSQSSLLSGPSLDRLSQNSLDRVERFEDAVTFPRPQPRVVAPIRTVSLCNKVPLERLVSGLGDLHSSFHSLDSDAGATVTPPVAPVAPIRTTSNNPLNRISSFQPPLSRISSFHSLDDEVYTPLSTTTFSNLTLDQSCDTTQLRVQPQAPPRNASLHPNSKWSNDREDKRREDREVIANLLSLRGKPTHSKCNQMRGRRSPETDSRTTLHLGECTIQINVTKPPSHSSSGKI